MRDLVDRLVRLALEEDLGPAGDVTSDAIFGPRDLAKASVVAREALVVAGLDVAGRVYRALDERVHFRPLCADGEVRAPGQPLADVAGPARALWSGERTAL